MIITSHGKANVKHLDWIFPQPTFFGALQDIIAECPLDHIAFLVSGLYGHAYAFTLGVQLGVRESHANGKRLAFSRVEYEGPFSDFDLDSGAWFQILSLWLLINDYRLSIS